MHLKNGWLPYPNGKDWRVNSLGVFTGHDIGYQIVILTGPTTVAGQARATGSAPSRLAARVINRALARRRGKPRLVSPPCPAALCSTG